jgi:hypothetical protein
MTEAETIEIFRRYQRWQRWCWLRRSWWQHRTRLKASSLECSFCRRHIPKDSPHQGVLGVEDFICRDCIALCAEAMAERDHDWRDGLIAAMRGVVEEK